MRKKNGRLQLYEFSIHSIMYGIAEFYINGIELDILKHRPKPTPLRHEKKTYL